MKKLLPLLTVLLESQNTFAQYQPLEPIQPFGERPLLYKAVRREKAIW
jgi:hypothetical protein